VTDQERTMTDTAAQIEAINDLRGGIKGTAADLLALKGKVIQALDGGVSVYDKRTTVGA
jgi:hypothetical protein